MRSVSCPVEFFRTLISAPSKGAYPRPGVEPNETIRPPLGS